MSNVRELALDVFEGREEAEKRIAKGEAKNRILEDYVKEILEIFKFSNSSKDSTVLIWQVRLSCIERENYCFAMISFDQKDNTEFKNALVFDCSWRYTGENTKLRDYIKKLQIPKELFVDIYKYFKENLAEYFETTKPDSEHIIIKLKSKS